MPCKPPKRPPLAPAPKPPEAGFAALARAGAAGFAIGAAHAVCAPKWTPKRPSLAARITAGGWVSVSSFVYGTLPTKGTTQRPRRKVICPSDNGQFSALPSGAPATTHVASSPSKMFRENTLRNDELTQMRLDDIFCIRDARRDRAHLISDTKLENMRTTYT